MGTRKKILLPTDFSRLSGSALRHAVEFAKGQEGELILLHVCESNHEACDRLEHPLKWMIRLSPVLANAETRVTPVVISGEPAAEGILEFCRENRIDMLVMGTHGRPTSSLLFLGSVAEKVLRGSSCPILTVGGEPSDRQPVYRKMLVGFDYSETSRKTVQYSSSLAETLGAEMHVMHVIELTPQPPYFSKWDELLTRERPQIIAAAEESMTVAMRGLGCYAATTHVIASQDQPDLEIVKFADQQGFDLIVLGAFGLVGQKTFFGRTAEQVVKSAGCPVLTFRPGPVS